MTNDSEKLKEVLFLLGECLNWCLFERNLNLKRALKKNDLFSHEVKALKLLSKNPPDLICLWLSDFMEKNGYHVKSRMVY